MYYINTILAYFGYRIFKLQPDGKVRPKDLVKSYITFEHMFKQDEQDGATEAD